MMHTLSPESASLFSFTAQCEDVFSTVAKEPAHIGVIAPYRAQCTKIRKALKQMAPEIKVGSVEEYQGDVSDFIK